MSKIHKIFVTIISVLSFSGCLRIYENMENCPTNIKVEFIYNADAKTNVITKYISNIRLYIYDETGKYISSQFVSEQELKLSGFTYLDIPKAGKYKIIAWGNTGGNTNISAKDLPNSNITNKNFDEGNVPKQNDPIYYGQGEIILNKSQDNVSTKVFFKNAHIKLDISIVGLDKTKYKPVVEIKNLFPEFNFNMEAGKSSSYIPNLKYEENKKRFYSSVNAFRFKNDNNISIIVSTKGGNSQKLVLKDFINEHSINVDDKQEVTIYVLFEYISLKNVVIKIPNWGNEQVKPSI